MTSAPPARAEQKGEESANSSWNGYGKQPATKNKEKANRKLIWSGSSFAPFCSFLYLPPMRTINTHKKPTLYNRNHNRRSVLYICKYEYLDLSWPLTPSFVPTEFKLRRSWSWRWRWKWRWKSPPVGFCLSCKSKAIREFHMEWILRICVCTEKN